jgi:hypothetical protein
VLAICLKEAEKSHPGKKVTQKMWPKNPTRKNLPGKNLTPKKLPKKTRPKSVPQKNSPKKLDRKSVPQKNSQKRPTPRKIKSKLVPLVFVDMRKQKYRIEFSTSNSESREGN